MPKLFAAALGFFDGVHTAHLRVLRAAARYAGEHGMESLAVTFDRPPRELTQGEPAPLLLTLEERIRIMRKEAQIGRVEVLRFDEEMRGMDARDFVRDVVSRRLGAGYVAAGFDYRFGAGGRGDAEALARYCRDEGIVCEIVGRYDEGGEKVSSTRIREALAAGDAAGAAVLLGRPFKITGEVISGKALGRRLGFPTMNVALPEGIVRPAPGVYVCRAALGGECYRAVCNISCDGMPLLEVHAFGCTGDAYGRTLETELLDRIRPMERFVSPEELRLQIERDKATAEAWFSARGR